MTTEEVIRECDGLATQLYEEGDEATADVLRLAASRLRKLHEATRWRPISEAPRDGTLLIGAVFPDGYPPIFFDCMWMNGYWVTSDDGDLNNLPTHFMPLPEGPEVTR